MSPSAGRAAGDARDAARGLIVHALTRYGEGGIRGWIDIARLGRRFAADFADEPSFAGPAAPHLRRALSRPGLSQGPLRLPRASTRDLAAALAADPRDPWALTLEGLRLYLTRRLEDAQACFTELTVAAPAWPWAWMLRAEACLYLGPARRALPDLARAKALRPGWAWPSMLEGRALFSARDEACLAALAEAARAAPALALARGWHGHALATLGRIEEGLAELGEAARLDPGYARAAAWMGMHLARSSRPEQGLAELERSLKLDPYYPPAHLARAETRLAGGDGRGAAVALKGLAGACVRAQWEANAASVHHLKRERDLPRTLRLCAAAAAAEPASPWPRLWLGQTLLAEGEAAGAAEALDDALSRGLRGSWRAWALLWRGRARARLGRYREARRDYGAALALSPRRAWALAWSSELSLAQGDGAKALRDAVAAATADPELADAWAALSAAREALGDESGALDACGRASALQPLWSWAKRRRLALAARLARWDEASGALASLGKAAGAPADLDAELRRRSLNGSRDPLLLPTAAWDEAHV